MGRFSFKTWLILPFIVIIRLPFALLMILTAKLSFWLENLSEFIFVIMTKLPELKYQKGYQEARNKKIREKVLKDYLKDSQIRN